MNTDPHASALTAALAIVAPVTDLRTREWRSTTFTGEYYIATFDREVEIEPDALLSVLERALDGLLVADIMQCGPDMVEIMTLPGRRVARAA